MEELKHNDSYTFVDGNKKHDIVLYALSTCGWCKRVKRLLDAEDVAYRFVFMDNLEPEIKAELKNHLRKHNPSCSYPTLIVNESKVVIGFEEDDIKKALK